MEELVNQLTDYLLEFQDKYQILQKDVNITIRGNFVSLTYPTIHAIEMYTDIINSPGFLERAHSINFILTSAGFANNSRVMIDLRFGWIGINKPYK